MSNEPKTLLEATKYFSDPELCRGYVERRRWPDGVVCPTCGSKSVKFLPSVNRYQCSKGHPKRQFTSKTGTVFEDSPLPLEKWLIAMWLIVNAKNGISSYEIHRAIGVTQKTAWFMLHRIRYALQAGDLGAKLLDHVEVDETYIGGKARNMHKHVRAQKIKGTGGAGSGKAVVMGMLERGGKVVTKHVEKPSKTTLQGHIQAHVEKGTAVSTDALKSYEGLSAEYVHGVVDHAVAYVAGSIHTNGLENYWSLLKRTIGGTYVSVEPFHLHRYLDEQSFRYNERKGTDGDRFDLATLGISGKRLTYRQLTGKELPPGRLD